MLTSQSSVNTTGARDRSADLLFAIALLGLFAGIMLVKVDLWRHNVLISDWVFMKNILWNTNLSGDILYSEMRFRQFGYPSYLNEHFSPILIPLAFLYKAAGRWGDLMLLALQGACPCLVAIALRGIAVQLFHDRRLAALMGVAFAFNPAILQPAIDSVYGFHSDSLSPPLIALAGWAFVAQRRVTYFAALIAALLVKENVPAYGIIAGGLLALSRQNRWLGLATALVSAAVFLIGARGLPLLTGFSNRNVGYAGQFVADVFALRPSFDYSRQELFYALRYGGAFLPALALWPFLAMVIPDLLVFGQVAHANLSSWHIMPVLATLAVLAAIGSHRFVEGTWPVASVLIRESGARRRVVNLYWAAVAVAAVAVAPVDLWIKHQRLLSAGSSIDQEALEHARVAIPREAGVATTTDLEAYFAHRRIVFTGLRAGGLEYVVVNAGAVSAQRCAALPEACASDQELIGDVERLAASGEATQIFSRGEVRAYRLARATSR